MPTVKVTVGAAITTVTGLDETGVPPLLQDAVMFTVPAFMSGPTEREPLTPPSAEILPFADHVHEAPVRFVDHTSVTDPPKAMGA